MSRDHDCKCKEEKYKHDCEDYKDMYAGECGMEYPYYMHQMHMPCMPMMQQPCMSPYMMKPYMQMPYHHQPCMPWMDNGMMPEDMMPVAGVTDYYEDEYDDYECDDYETWVDALNDEYPELCDEAKCLLKKIMAVDFARVDLNLYLDTHPMDRKALAQYNKYVCELKNLTKRFEKLYGPIHLMQQIDYPWAWLNQPWPWRIDFGE